MAELRAPRAVFMAFGTKGDVLPIAAIAAALACHLRYYYVVFITHSSHQGLKEHLESKNVSFVPISSPPVLSAHQNDSECMPFTMRKKMIQEDHRRDCLSAVESVFGDGPTVDGDFIVINFFALEGWSLAELFHVRCVVAAPYVVPYSAPSTFERQFKQELPLLYKYFKEAPENKVSWKDVLHWMWPLFTEEWGSWRSEYLNLSPLPFTDPVTNLPMWHARVQSPLLLYGFSKEIVECPDYWPLGNHVCGFWFLPMEWQFSCSKCRETLCASSSNNLTPKNDLCANHSGLEQFLAKKSTSSRPIFVGLSSVGSMGFIPNPRAFLLVLKAVIEITGYSFILFSAAYEPLDAAIRSVSRVPSDLDEPQKFPCSQDCRLIFNDQLFCFSGVIPYTWLFPKCAVAVHHGGSGSTAAALLAGIPQVVCPFLLDQFYWAERLCWLGVAPEPLLRHHLVPNSDVAASLGEAANAFWKALKIALSPEIMAQASKVAERISSEDGVGEALKILEEEEATCPEMQKG